MKKIILLALVLALVLAGVSTVSALGYAESFNTSDSHYNVSKLNVAGALTASGGRNMTMWFQEFQSIGTPTQFFYSSGTAWNNGWLYVVDTANETKEGTVTFHKNDNTVQFGQGKIHYQINYITGTTTPKFINVWIDQITQWDPALIGNPAGAYNVFLHYDLNELNGLYLSPYTNNGAPSVLGHSLGWIFRPGYGANSWASPSTSGFTSIMTDQRWNSYLDVEFYPGYSTVTVLKNGYPSTVKINSSAITYWDSYSGTDITGLMIGDSAFTFNITTPYSVSFRRTLYNNAETEESNYILQLDKTTAGHYETITGTLEYTGPGADPADQIVYQTPGYAGAGGYQNFKKTGSTWYRYDATTSSWIATTASDAYTGSIYWEPSFGTGPSTFDCYIHAGGSTVEEFHIPVEITSSASFVQVSIEARDIDSGALIPNANLNLTVASSGANTAYDLGVTGKRYFQLPRDEFYKFNVTKTGYLYPNITSGSGYTLWYSLYTGTFEGQNLIEAVAYLKRSYTLGTNQTSISFHVTDAVTLYDIPGAWIEIKNQSNVLVAWGETQDYGGKTFTLPANQTYFYTVEKSGGPQGVFLSASGSFYTDSSKTINVQLSPAPVTTLPPGVTTPITPTPDYQHSEEARAGSIWAGLAVWYSHAGEIMELAFFVVLLTLLGYMSGALDKIAGKRRK